VKLLRARECVYSWLAMEPHDLKFLLKLSASRSVNALSTLRDEMKRVIINQA